MSPDGPWLPPITFAFYGLTSNYRVMQLGTHDVGAVKNKTGNASKIETVNCPFIAL